MNPSSFQESLRMEEMSKVLYFGGNFMASVGFIYTFNRANILHCVSQSLGAVVERLIIRGK